MTWINAGAAWIPQIQAMEAKDGIPNLLSCRQCYQESRFNPDAKNATSGAVGLFQLLPQFFPGAGADPVKDITTACGYLASLHKRFADWQLALAAYDWGPGNLSEWLKDKGTFATLPTETQNYVSQIVADVPVQGVLCKIPSSPELGSLPEKSSVAASSAPPPHKSLLQSATDIFTHHSAPSSPAPSPPSVSPPLAISSPTQSKEVSMSTPNPIAAAAAPSLIAVLEAIQAFNTNIGANPAEWPLKVPGAFTVLLGTVQMQLPALAAAEAGTLQADVNAKLAGWIASLKKA
jgi:hypothetical protein